MTKGWPAYQPAIFTGWDSVPPDARKTIQSAGVPRSFFGKRYRALAEPKLVVRPNGGDLVRFGDTMIFGGIYLDPSTGKVVELTDHPSATPEPVNSSLERFVTTVKAVIDLFPFYSLHSTLENRMNVGSELARVIRQIDPASAEPDSFWGNFVDDVINGDFATEEVVDLPGGEQ